MNLFTGESSSDLFGGEVPRQVKSLLERARHARSMDEALSLLWTAQVCAPQSLAVHYLLYKLYARQTDFDKAQEVALKALQLAAEQAGLPANWRQVRPDMADFQTPGPARFWLFTLKALAFINLRLQHRLNARSYLKKVEELDPLGGSGASVIDALMKGSEPSA